ncbi:hypothetical protein DVH05_025851 [Phytophthora capsici]|nr:hypothetical protein DVH05_025851 [Phytophthora capsici]|eukprot:jgi/Phyca11/15089/fgenesh1_pg.PHYCAscaffold_11_\
MSTGPELCTLMPASGKDESVQPWEYHSRPLRYLWFRPAHDGLRLEVDAIPVRLRNGRRRRRGFSRSANTEQEIRRLGADEFVVYTDEKQPAGAANSFNAFSVVGKGVKFVGSNIGSIKDMLEVASKKDVRPAIQKLPMSKVNEGIKMVRDGTMRYRVVLEN